LGTDAYPYKDIHTAFTEIFINLETELKANDFFISVKKGTTHEVYLENRPNFAYMPQHLTVRSFPAIDPATETEDNKAYLKVHCLGCISFHSFYRTTSVR
jgi:hypothetical protein